MPTHFRNVRSPHFRTIQFDGMYGSPSTFIGDTGVQLAVWSQRVFLPDTVVCAGNDPTTAEWLQASQPGGFIRELECNLRLTRATLINVRAWIDTYLATESQQQESQEWDASMNWNFPQRRN